MSTYRTLRYLCAMMCICMFAYPTYLTANQANMTMPSTMEEFVNWHLDRGAFGTWNQSGVTKDMWVGIPAGLSYTNTNTLRYDPKTSRIFSTYEMITEDGLVISTGVGMTYWNPELDAPVSTSSGFDMGKPYTGSSTLVGIKGDAIYWAYTEESQGKNTAYENIQEFTGPNTRRDSVSVIGSNVEPWVTTPVRNNPAGNMLNSCKLTGTWETPLPNGETLKAEVSWIADDHVLRQERSLVRKDGSSYPSDMYLMYWDPSHHRIATLYLDEHGAVIHGYVKSITHGDDKSVTIVSAHEGHRYGGLTMSTEMTRVITDDSITTSFDGMALNSLPHQMSWTAAPGKTNRVN